jgi:succinyl-CoA synthetase alpha subunit
MINLSKLKSIDPNIILIGSHPGIIQSMLDFDYLAGREKPSVVGIIAAGRKFERYFFGKNEVLIPVYSDFETISSKKKESINLFLNVSSARRVLSNCRAAFEAFPQVLGGVVFAEDVPEKHSIELFELAKEKKKFIVGPASVGLLIPKVLKLGAIGGTDYRQLLQSHLLTPGSVAVFSASGGMTNEIIRIVASSGARLSFSLHFGGDRFPITQPLDAFELAEKDPSTDTIVYYGELGGFDEYKIVDLIKSKKLTKKIICYIAGTISDLFETPPQFGHAKAMAASLDQGARSKRDALKKAGAYVAESFEEFVEMIGTKGQNQETGTIEPMDDLQNRRHALIATSVSKDDGGDAQILGENLLDFATNHSFAYEAVSMFLGKKIKSRELEQFVDLVLRLLVDHGPYVSGAVNTIITSRAGRDMVSSLASGLLTIGPRFGGAINQAAANWLKGVGEGFQPAQFVEEFASQKVYIQGIGHKKYRADFPDPRVAELLKFANKLTNPRFTNFARSVEKVTSAKKGNLILNVDGTIAAVMLDLLSSKEKYSDEELQQLVHMEFFNAFFVLSRSVGFISHFLDQKRLDEGLFRLPDDMVAQADLNED